MLSDQEKQAVKSSWRLVVPIAETAADLFYKRLFELKPEYEVLFPDDMAAQKRKLLRMLAFVVRAIDWAEDSWRDDVPANEDLMLVILAMGRRHSELYKIPDESYAVVGEALLWTLDKGLADAFTDDVKGAWTQLYTLLAQTMRMGSTMVARDDSWTDPASSQQQGEAALVSQSAAVGVDDSSIGIGEDVQ